MKYMLLIFGDETKMAGTTPEEMSATMDAWFKYTADLEATGKLLHGEALQPTATATTVHGSESGRTTVDGPFAETKEQLGGFYIIDADDLDEAIDWAGKMPHMSSAGTVEVRPIMEFDH